jgi:hypothetical protein
MKLEVKSMGSDKGDIYYVFEDLASHVYPNDQTISNVELEQEFLTWLRQTGKATIICEWTSGSKPYGIGVLTGSPGSRYTSFDSEGGMMEWHNFAPEPVERVAKLFREFAATKGYKETPTQEVQT